MNHHYRSADLFVALVAAAIAVGVLVSVPREIAGETLAAITDMGSPAFFPILAACVMLFCAIALALKAIQDVRAGIGLAVEFERRTTVSAVMGMFVLFAIGTYYVGMLLSAFVTIILMATWLGYRNWWLLPVVALAVPASIYVLFERVLLILLPRGLVFQ